MHGISDQYVSPDVSSSETQGQSVESGEKAGRKFSSMGKRASGYRLSPNHFQKIQADTGSWLGTKNALYYCAQSANSFSWVLFVSSPDPTRLTAPGSPRMLMSQHSYSLTWQKGLCRFLKVKFETFFKTIFLFLDSNKRSTGTLKEQDPRSSHDALIK